MKIYMELTILHSHTNKLSTVRMWQACRWVATDNQTQHSYQPSGLVCHLLILNSILRDTEHLHLLIHSPFITRYWEKLTVKFKFKFFYAKKTVKQGPHTICIYLLGVTWFHLMDFNKSQIVTQAELRNTMAGLRPHQHRQLLTSSAHQIMLH